MAHSMKGLKSMRRQTCVTVTQLKCLSEENIHTFMQWNRDVVVVLNNLCKKSG
jgi:hypothetical protein